MLAGARFEVGAPAFTPRPYGLLSVAQVIDEVDVHWENGILTQPEACEPAAMTVGPCPSPPADKVPTSTIPVRCADPFTVYADISCSPIGVGGNGLDGYRDRVVAALTNGEARRVENVFWTGGAGAVVSPHLAANTPITGSGCVLQTAATVIGPVTGTGVSPCEAVGLLEGALGGCYGGLGVLHIPLWTLSMLVTNYALFKDGPRFRTAAGTPVAVGAGYPGTGADGSAPPAGSAWFYVTGAVQVRRSPIIVPATAPESLNRAKNTMVMVAERTYEIDWDCCHFAVLADVGSYSPPLMS
jgi:hypothetical protein